MDDRYSKGLRELIHSLLQRNPDDRPGIENVMAMPIMVNPLMNLCTDIGRLPCSRSGSVTTSPHGGHTFVPSLFHLLLPPPSFLFLPPSYLHPPSLLPSPSLPFSFLPPSLSPPFPRSAQEPSGPGAVGRSKHPPSCGTRMGSLGQYRQRSFFEDDYDTSKQEVRGQEGGREGGREGVVLHHVSTLQSLLFCLQTRVKVVYKPRVYYWGGGVSVPTTLPLLPDSQMVDVSAGRMQWAGVTENGKLVFWEVRCMCVGVRSE